MFQLISKVAVFETSIIILPAKPSHLAVSIILSINIFTKNLLIW